MLFHVILSNTNISVTEINQEQFDLFREVEGYSKEDTIFEDTLYCVQVEFNPFRYECIISTTAASAAYTKAFAHACNCH